MVFLSDKNNKRAVFIKVIITTTLIFITFNRDSVPARENLPFRNGEKISYYLKWGNINIGTAEATFLGKTNLNGQDVYLVHFRTKTANFNDLERIYADLNEFYPVKIERTITLGAKKIEILEEYNHKDNGLKITKKSSGKVYNDMIKRNSKMQNAILLFYYCRSLNFKVGDSFSVALPSLECKVKVVREEDIDLAIGKRKAYLFETNPEKVRFWIGTGNDRLLLKIESSVVFGRLVMAIKGVDFDTSYK